METPAGMDLVAMLLAEPGVDDKDWIRQGEPVALCDTYKIKATFIFQEITINTVEKYIVLNFNSN